MVLERVLQWERQVKIVNELAINGYLSRGELVRLTGYPRTTLYDNLKRLIKQGIIEKYTEHTSIRGRPKVYYKLMECAD